MKILINVLLCCITIASVSAQRVGIGTTTPHTSALLELKSTNRGVLIPRMTTAQRDAIVDPAEGLMILNLDDKCVDIYDGSEWIKNCGMRLTGTDTLTAEWKQRASLGSGSKFAAVSFSINGKGYVGTGFGNNQAPTNDLRRYDPVTNAWSQMANVPGSPRAYAIGFATSDYGYVGLGSINSYNYPLFTLNDMYKYDPELNQWSGIDAFPAHLAKAVSFNINGTWFVGTGENNNTAIPYMWEFEPQGDYFISAPSFPFPAHSLTAFEVDGIGYVGNGYMNGSLSSSMYSFDGTSWELATYYPGGNLNSTAVGLGSKGYMGTGGCCGLAKATFYSYTPETNTWSQLPDCSSIGRFLATSFKIDGKIYVFGGLSNSNGAKNDLWEFEVYPIGNVYETQNNLEEPVASISDGLWTKYESTLYPMHTNKNGIVLLENGNVGIGTDSTFAPLQFKNEYKNRKIVLWQNLPSSNHKYFGFGVNAGEMRYQVDATTSNHIFYAAANSVASWELFRITGTGNVGIKNAAPHAPLQFSNFSANRKIVLYENSNNDHKFIGFGTGTGSLLYQVDTTASNHIFSAGVNSTTSNELVRISGTGFVGIGNSTPHAPLQFSNVAANRKIVISESANNDHQFNGFGLNPGGLLRYQVESTTSAHLFFAATGAGGSNEIFRIQGNGKLGVAGMTSPNGLLQFPNSVNYRKLVLFELANNENQYMGLGTYTNELLYQVDNTTSSHVFYTGLTAASSDELMRITGTGYVGIDNAAPFAPLHFKNAVATRKIVLFGPINNNYQFYGFGVDASTLRYQIDAISSNHVFYAGNGSADDNELLRITGSGNVGINNAAPHAPLQFSNDQVARKIVLHETVNNDNQFDGIGLVGTNMRYQVASTSMDHMFMAATSSDASDVLMRVKGNGNMTLSGIIEQSAWIPSTLLNGFGNLGGDFATAAYFKDKIGMVHLRGTVEKAGSPQGFVIFVLPVGYRPSTSGKLVFPAMNGAGIARVDVTAGGNVEVTFGSVGTIHLDGITFRAD